MKLVARIRTTLLTLSPRAEFIGLAVGMSILSLADIAVGRPGAGNTFSGGYRGGGGSSGGGGWSGGGYGGGYSGSGYSGGGGSGNGGLELIAAVIQFCLEYPAIGIPTVLVGIVVAYVYLSRSSPLSSGWSTGSVSYNEPIRAPTPPVSAQSEVRRGFVELRHHDPDFSTTIFEDFAYALFATVHVARGRRQLDRLTPYVLPEARSSLELLSDSLSDVEGVVVGAMRCVRAGTRWGQPPVQEIVVEFESNYTEVSASAQRTTYYAVERWRLVRIATARSRPPDRARVVGCPNCGAPLDALMGTTCGSCRQTVSPGVFDWAVQVVEPRSRESRGPQLTGTVPERGTDLPTIIDPSAASHLAAIQARDSLFSWQAFQQRVGVIFAELQHAWSEQQWDRARAFVSDALHESQQYWIETYKRAGLRNITANAAITAMELARVDSDRYFDAIVMRIYASGADYTVDQRGHVVGGSKHKDRPYSEYWTLIRSAARRGAAGTEPKCPNCGAELKINMAGHCEYCHTKITTGEFDWVLSRIEQDEAYG